MRGRALLMKVRAPRVLLIDGDPNARALHLAALFPLGCRIIEATNGRDGYESFSQEGADLVITVDNGSDSTGLEMVRKIRQAEEERTCRRGRLGYEGVPVLFLKRNGQEGLEDEAGKLGGCTVLREPFYPRQLRRVVEAALLRR
jgi:DNA-binding response OmpR family regulator